MTLFRFARKTSAALLTLALGLSNAAPAWAHFGMVLPSVPTVMENKDADLKVELKFWHPFKNKGMNLVKPKSFQVWNGGQATDLRFALKEGQENGFIVWAATYRLNRPGQYAFIMEPEPYWEPEEDKFIIHYTKTYVDAFGNDEGCFDPLPGLKTEIIPLVKPGGLYAGNVFIGRVLLDGQNVSNAEVEIEWYPGPGLAGQAPSESMVTQVVKTDERGIFIYAPPRAGWWGFAALNKADYKLKQNDQDKEVELGAVLWLYFHKFQPPTPLK
ncbi:MAG: hypothetical protein AMR96_03140 [Candidatus Adiutrix intracellularis]|nr:MAG: hypothetical protein AMR96_03140 [Candidatus Adiutrix intracellularis]